MRLEDIKFSIAKQSGENMLHVIFTLALLLPVTAAQAASFNCEKARTEVEMIVCRNNEISKLDDLLSKLYNRTYDNFINSNYSPILTADLVKSQKTWLKSVRDTCKDAACVKHAYESRINEIGLQIEGDSNEDSDASRHLSLKCNYLEDLTTPVQEVSISGAVYSRGQPAAVKEFTAGSLKPQHVELVVKPGQFAECIYPSGFRIRVKVREGEAYPYGMCGGDPEVFFSLWINERKVSSRIWFAGHCRDDSPVTYTITSMPCPQSIKTSGTTESGVQSSGHTEICASSEFLNGFSIDTVEYPPKGVKMPQTGDYEVVEGSDKVCTAVTGALTEGDYFRYNNRSNSGDIEHLSWNKTQDLPDDLSARGYARDSSYDFDNDGNLDRVITLSYSTHYMDATVLLVQPGKSPDTLDPIAPLQNSATLSIPCQVTGQPSDYNDCPPYTQKRDEAGFAFGESSVYFRSRYSVVEPFLYKGDSYILIRNGSADSNNYFAVLKPLPHRKFEHSCLIRQVVENY
jgi:uncharacterized protein